MALPSVLSQIAIESGNPIERDVWLPKRRHYNDRPSVIRFNKVTTWIAGHSITFTEWPVNIKVTLYRGEDRLVEVKIPKSDFCQNWEPWGEWALNQIQALQTVPQVPQKGICLDFLESLVKLREEIKRDLKKLESEAAMGYMDFGGLDNLDDLDEDSFDYEFGE